jgi:hypothetical protein
MKLTWRLSALHDSYSKAGGEPQSGGSRKPWPIDHDPCDDGTRIDRLKRVPGCCTIRIATLNMASMLNWREGVCVERMRVETL